ncbi:hypothetical protein [Niabella beijingensis]|uniref:hypothetical protein n=1 Tax=Niabella beijingensis TaxID=2872700 RepID=UPI001CBD18CE|nr:hypothetical protein [Niabella beijingensis]MBZ4190460.1 hypothetical protein [Niabella beijingensis]
MKARRYIRFLLILSAAGFLAGCQKNGDSTPSSYTLTTIYENPLPEPVSIQYMSGRINPEGDTTILLTGEKILVDANSSTQVVETICLKDCPPSSVLLPFNIAKIIIGEKQRTAVNCSLMPAAAGAPACSDTSNIFNIARWSVSSKNPGEMLKTYTLTNQDIGEAR